MSLKCIDGGRKDFSESFRRGLDITVRAAHINSPNSPHTRSVKRLWTAVFTNRKRPTKLNLTANIDFYKQHGRLPDNNKRREA